MSSSRILWFFATLIVAHIVVREFRCCNKGCWWCVTRVGSSGSGSSNRSDNDGINQDGSERVTRKLYRDDGAIIVDRNPGLRGEHVLVEERACRQLESDVSGFIERYVSRFGKFVSADNAKELFADYAGSAENRTKFGAAVRIAGRRGARAVLYHVLDDHKERGKGGVLVMTAGGTGAGKTYTVDEVMPALKHDADCVYDSTLNSLVGARTDIGRALDAGMQVQIAYVYRDPVEAFGAVLERASVHGRTLRAGSHMRTHRNALRTVLKLQEEFADKVSFKYFINAAGAHPRSSSLREIVRLAPSTDVDWDQVQEKIAVILEEAKRKGEISDVMYEAMAEWTQD